MLRWLAARAEVHVLSFVHDEHEAAQAHTLSAFAASVTAARIPRLRNWLRAAASVRGTTPLTHILLDAPGLRETVSGVYQRCRPDVVLAYCSSTVRLALEPPLDRVPLVLDLLDVDSRKWADLAERSRGLRRLVYGREARHLRAFERRAAAAATATLVINEREVSVFRDIAPEADIHVVGNGIDVGTLQPPANTVREPRVVFCGVMNYRPNEEGALWLAQHVWPLVRAQRPEARLTIVGSFPTRRLRVACARDRSIDLVGGVPDVRPYLWQGAVAAAPLHVARGLQNKVLEALAAGLPSVVTPAVAEGLPPAVRDACAVCAAPDAFADALVRRLAWSDLQRRANVATAGLEQLAWDAVLKPLWPLLLRAVDGIVRPTQQIA
jgi:sugar transferase (PEP-CTERM/EpsH1 system associated)